MFFNNAIQFWFSVRCWWRAGYNRPPSGERCRCGAVWGQKSYDVCAGCGRALCNFNFQFCHHKIPNFEFECLHVSSPLFASITLFEILNTLFATATNVLLKNGVRILKNNCFKRFMCIGWMYDFIYCCWYFTFAVRNFALQVLIAFKNLRTASGHLSMRMTRRWRDNNLGISIPASGYRFAKIAMILNLPSEASWAERPTRKVSKTSRNISPR